MQLKDERPGGIFTKRFWTEPRPRTALSRGSLIWFPIAVLGHIALAVWWFTR